MAEDARAAGLVPQLGNILDKLPKRLQPRVKAALHDVIHAETRSQAREAVTRFATEYGPKYPKAVTTPEKDADVLLTFFDFPAEHWKTDGQSVAGRTRPALHTDPNRVAVRSSARCRFKRPARKDHMAKVTLRTSDQRLQAGKALRGKCPRLSHGKVVLGQGDKRDVVALIKASNEDRLEIKEARRSVLEPYTGTPRVAHNGQRVVVGQRLMQSASDIFLGWARGPAGRAFYVRQLRDMKVAPAVESQTPQLMRAYATLCGLVLARAHDKAGDAAMIAGYLGKSDQFDEAIGDYAVAYADQVERDYATFVRAVRTGRLKSDVSPSPLESALR